MGMSFDFCEILVEFLSCLLRDFIYGSYKVRFEAFTCRFTIPFDF
jgi:hypothetical protein